MEPFNRLKNRANLFRPKNYSSQIDISNHCSSLSIDQSELSNKKGTRENNNIVLKRSTSMLCPQQRFQTFLKINHYDHHNLNCFELSNCSINDSSTDDYHFVKSSSNYYWNKKLYSKMSNINEQDVFSSEESLNEKIIEEGKEK